VKKTRENQRKLQAFVEVHGSNGKLDKETLDRSLDLMLKAADDINRELDKLLAKARGE
jgi:DNA-binding IclR family transcriptional regulator